MMARGVVQPRGDVEVSEQPVPRFNNVVENSLVPWVTSFAYFASKDISTKDVAVFWTKRGANLFVLEPYVQFYVQCAIIPLVLRSCYNNSWGESWVLKPDLIPPAAREFFPNLPREQNMMEWEELPMWQRPLYDWSDSEEKYRLTALNDKWHVDAE